MTNRTNSKTVSEFIDRLEGTLGLLGPISVIAKFRDSESGSFSFLSHDTARRNSELLRPIPLRNRQDQVDLFLTIVMTFRVVRDTQVRGRSFVSVSSYIYRLADCSDRAVMTFHFHPAGKSWYVGYHAHAERFPSIWLHQISNPEAKTREIHGHTVHIPTQEMLAEDIVDLLRNDFGVKLTDSNNQRVNKLLAANRSAQVR